MSISSEMRRLGTRFGTSGWPQFLSWIEIENIRGWSGQRIEFNFPIVALVGENGAGKSTILQAAAAAYSSPTSDRYASDFFPDTPFEKITSASIKYSYKQGQKIEIGAVRKPTNRWRGNSTRPIREVQYIDLRRLQPVSARTGYAQLLKKGVTPNPSVLFSVAELKRLNFILGKDYTNAGISSTNAGLSKTVPLLGLSGQQYSGFHQGAGEITATELLAAKYPKYSLILIDEIETSLHPRAQRRLMRDLAEIARLNELQIIVTTHSPYVLEELPEQARIYLMEGSAGKRPVTGVSPDFAMTRMDEEAHPECDIYVEDDRAKALLSEILVKGERDLLSRCKIIPFGSAQVGKALGLMVSQKRFPRPSLVYLDGDQDTTSGCIILPGNDAPEQVVFTDLRAMNWPDISSRIGRGASETIDALTRAMINPDHHMWVTKAGDDLVMGSDALWQVLASSWVQHCTTNDVIDGQCQPIRDALAGILQ